MSPATTPLAAQDPGAEIRIDPHIAAMFPQPSPSEYDEMQRLLRTEGCRTPVHVWAGCNILLDDPVRLAMCRRLRVPFAVEAHALTDRAAAEAFVAAHLLTQRNLSPEASAYYRGKRYLDEKRRHGGSRPTKGASGQLAHLKTAERLGKEHGVDECTVRRDGKFARAVDTVATNCGPEATQAILAHHGGLRRRTVLRLARLSPEEQQRIIKLVCDLGRLPRGAIPLKRRTMVVPREPRALGRAVVDRLGEVEAGLAMRTIRRILRRRAGN